MRVVYLVSYRKGIMCGVMDYTKQLVQAMNNLGVDASIELVSSWSFKALWNVKKKYKQQQDIIFHLQYPSVGMGLSPAPSLLPIFFRKNKVLVTLHEFGSFNVVRKFYFVFFEFFRKAIVFTNEHERSRYKKFFPWIKTTHAIIPIGNNIDVVKINHEEKASPRLIYFGQIVKNKGIEEFIETVKLLRSRGNEIKCSIIGALIEKENDLSLHITKAASEYHIECLYNLSSEEVSRQLSASTIALLLFKDGISDKRGSAIACLKHGVSVVTRHSKYTPSWWQKTTYSVEKIEDSIRMIEDITSGNKERIPNPEILKDALKQREWGHIAHDHIKLYESLKN